MTSSARVRGSTRSRRARPRGVFRKRGRVIVVVLAGALAVAAGATAAGLIPLGKAVREITLPLRHEDIIRQQAREKALNPALIAAVIYQESKFRDQTSRAGARGLMQVTPETARFIARRTGGVRFTHADLATPQINIAYGSYYLRYLMDRYEDNDVLAIAAYNAGHTNVDRWVAAAGGTHSFDPRQDIPFPETRSYVGGVLEQRERYRERYGAELGL